MIFTWTTCTWNKCLIWIKMLHMNTLFRILFSDLALSEKKNFFFYWKFLVDLTSGTILYCQSSLTQIRLTSMLTEKFKSLMRIHFMTLWKKRTHSHSYWLEWRSAQTTSLLPLTITFIKEKNSKVKLIKNNCLKTKENVGHSPMPGLL